MEHLFRFELGEGARTRLKSKDFVYIDDSEGMELDQEGDPKATPQEVKQIDQPTQVYMECIMLEVERQVEAADPGKFLMDLKDLRVLPVVGKDPKAKLYKIGGEKKNEIKGGTMMIRAVRPSMDREDYPD